MIVHHIEAHAVGSDLRQQEGDSTRPASHQGAWQEATAKAVGAAGAHTSPADLELDGLRHSLLSKLQKRDNKTESVK